MNQQISFACGIKTSSLDTEGPIEVFQTTSHIETEAERLLSTFKYNGSHKAAACDNLAEGISWFTSV